MMQSNTLTAKTVKLAEQNGVLDKIFGEEVNRMIRKRYTASEEIAIHRHFLNEKNIDEFNEYNSFCEECKNKVRAQIERLLLDR